MKISARQTLPRVRTLQTTPSILADKHDGPSIQRFSVSHGSMLCCASDNGSVSKPSSNLKRDSPAMLHCCEALIGPSVLDCDMACLANEIQRVRDAGCDYIHLDVMDGHFVPNISFGPYVIQCARKHHPDIFFDCHMMTSHPEKWVEQVAKAQGSKEGLLCYTFHAETTEDRGLTQQVIDSVKANNMKVGFAVSPDTQVEVLMKYGDQIDLALVMTVHPGRGGQSFMEDMMGKVMALREKFPTLDIEVDGGLKPATIEAAAKAGANLIVSGSGVFKAENMSKSIEIMRDSVKTLGPLKPIKPDAEATPAAAKSAQA